ncbi:hypothetical protein A2617_01655 [Candidatus Daviesbacteria bacterium RIFOXYD1_FULL_41_10]|uniref:NGG1p interacting factor NIF3 n=2 Tax=Candidatus Daviesiibacteriota TaxID=1752718 RepID=A0A1F5MZJ3_9BACT|nr:MAG: hypothetical protein UU67_C0032G0009 [Candidatus Daviesbacteria bacterium GW2011_GWB1_41_5]OGE70771.1 MAG: hypothetical protein A2617_01655 [Candidatus Daviesbacteria bacterium RIFOXYD1_FULL_41_10]
MELLKIVVFVPISYVNIVLGAIGNAGAGLIGNYSHCTFSIKGIGRFRPLEGAKPFIGSVGKLEELEEERVEFVCPKEKARDVISAIKKVHPYEEVALDIYPLLDEEDL